MVYQSWRRFSTIKCAESIPVKEFINLNLPIFDVRSPSEYKQGRIPGAFSLPLFTDEERKQVGITYKNVGKNEAVLQGLELVGPKLHLIVKQVQNYLKIWNQQKNMNENKVLVHCWRGGKRSESVAWMLNLFGYHAITLDKGYKAFRLHMIEVLERPYNFLVLGGKTGSGKTDILQILKQKGEQVIDLEEIACHKGSVFGRKAFDLELPSQEQFENELAFQLEKLDSSKMIWLENESKRIGDVGIPNSIWSQFSTAPTFFIEVSHQMRVQRLVQEYGACSIEYLKECVGRLDKLGKNSIEAVKQMISDGKLELACEKLLKDYYDILYSRSSKKREAAISVNVNHLTSTEEIASELLSCKSQFLNKKIT